MGCRPYERQINVRAPSSGFRSITKGKLAEKIAREMHDYMNVSARQFRVVLEAVVLHVVLILGLR